MSTLVHTPSGTAAHNVRRPALRLLERPSRHDATVAAASSPVHESLGDWLVRQVERYWAWGEQHAQHHRLGSWLRH